MRFPICRLLHVIVVGVAGPLLLGAGGVVQPSWPVPPDVATVTVNGYPMAYVERGSGSTVVLVHGAVSDYRTWDLQLPSLAPRARVIAVSLRHYYPERWNGQGATFSEKQHASDVAAFIEQLRVGPVNLVGHSRGALVTILAAQARPDLVRKLVLMEPTLTALHPPPPGAPEDRRITRWRETVRRFEAAGIEEGLEYFIDDVIGAGAWKRQPEARRQAFRENAWTIAGQLRDTGTIGCADVGRLKMPVLLVGSEKITKPNLEALEGGHKCVPVAQRVDIAKAGHGMHRDNPEAFNAALLKFLFD